MTRPGVSASGASFARCDLVVRPHFLRRVGAASALAAAATNAMRRSIVLSTSARVLDRCSQQVHLCRQVQVQWLYSVQAASSDGVRVRNQYRRCLNHAAVKLCGKQVQTRRWAKNRC